MHLRWPFASVVFQPPENTEIQCNEEAQLLLFFRA